MDAPLSDYFLDEYFILIRFFFNFPVFLLHIINDHIFNMLNTEILIESNFRFEMYVL